MIGCQFSLYPMTNSFEMVILEAVGDLKKDKKLRVETDDLSTMLYGPPENVFKALKACFLRAGRATDHIVLNVTFSHGCPGEPDGHCNITDHAKTAKVTKREYKKDQATRLPVSAQFALYPLNNTGYMGIIYEEIEKAKQLVKVTPKHYCTRLDGDLSDVLKVIRQSFDNAADKVNHVVVTATISKKS